MDELELENEKMVHEFSRLEISQNEGEWQAKKVRQLLEEEVKGLRVEIKDLESKHKLELKS